jgi:hypothetical protein
VSRKNRSKSVCVRSFPLSARRIDDDYGFGRAASTFLGTYWRPASEDEDARTAVGSLASCRARKRARSIDLNDETISHPVRRRRYSPPRQRKARAQCARALCHNTQAATRLTRVSAISVSFLSAADSSTRFCLSTLAQSSRPSSLAQAIKAP